MTCTLGRPRAMNVSLSPAAQAAAGARGGSWSHLAIAPAAPSRRELRRARSASTKCPCVDAKHILRRLARLSPSRRRPRPGRTEYRRARRAGARPRVLPRQRSRSAVKRLERAGWMLNAGQAHRGQGTRNRRVLWPEQYFELLWVIDAAEARANPLRLDRRADWSATGASPVGLALRGRVESASADEFWLYDALGPRIWIPATTSVCGTSACSSSRPTNSRSVCAPAIAARCLRRWRIAGPASCPSCAFAVRQPRRCRRSRDRGSAMTPAQICPSWSSVMDAQQSRYRHSDRARVARPLRAPRPPQSDARCHLRILSEPSKLGTFAADPRCCFSQCDSERGVETGWPSLAELVHSASD